MTRHEFFGRLNAAMAGFPATEINRVNEYYGEYWDDALEAGKTEEEASAGLDAPEAIAARLRTEFRFDAQQQPPPGAPPMDRPGNSAGRIVLIVLVAVFAVPIALPLALGLFGALFGLIMAVFGVAVGLFCASLAMLCGGLALAVSGLPVLAASPLAGMWMLGGGLLVAGIGLLLGVGCFALFKGMISLCAKAVRALRRRPPATGPERIPTVSREV